ncbi:MAG TPA: BTAD domain-containing putative transcriptional regulator [Propionibacteriaceae bacterium]
MDFSVLGPLEVSHDGESVLIRRGLPRGLLVYLLLHRRVPVAAEVLADRLWSGEPPADAANAVQRVVSYLRRALGDAGHGLLATKPSGYVLLVEDHWVDAFRFEQQVRAAVSLDARGTAAGARRALEELNAAMKLWRGEPFSDVAQHEWAVAEIVRLEELKTQAQGLGLAGLLQLNRADEAVGQARALVAEHPLQEQFHSLLVLALYRSGRQSEALAAYSTARRLLSEELGLDPGPQLQMLERQVLDQAPELDWVPPPDWVSSGAQGDEEILAPSGLPAAVTSLVGRDWALLQLSQTLAGTRLLTLTGAGGVGKSRLVLELAQRETRRRVWWVQLDVVAEAELVASTVAHALGAVVPPGVDPVEAVAQTISDDEALLVLDGCERVAAAAAELVDQLQRRCPSLVQLVTSRRPLRVAGEVTWPVPPLDLPGEPRVGSAVPPVAASLQLFEERAKAARPDFVIDAGTEADVAAIVRALDGLPLAIELAAAHIDVLPPAGILRRLADRFDLLQDERWDAPARQHTLRAAIDSSVALLAGDEREHFGQLGVFAGSFDLDAVEAVTCTAPAKAYRLTASLVRQSLVAPVEGGRFRLLESMRVYAREDLVGSGRLTDVQSRHAQHLLALMTAADQGLRGPDQQEWLIRVRASVPDLRAALDWLLGGADPAQGARLAAMSTWFWTREGMLDEAARWMERAAEVPVSDRAIRAAVLHASGRIAAPLGNLRAARDACTSSVALSRALGDDGALGRALVTLGLCEWALGDLPAAARAHEEAADRAEATGDRWHHDAALVLRLRTAIDAGEPDVEQRLDRVLARVRSTGDQHLVGLALGQQARLGLISGDPDRAYAAATSSLDYWRSVNYREGEVQALNLLARASVVSGRLEEAASEARAAVLAAADIGHRGGLAEGLETLAEVRHAAGLDDQALELLTVAQRERDDAAVPVPAADRAAVEALRRSVAERLDASTDPVLGATRRRDLDDVVTELREVT